MMDRPVWKKVSEIEKPGLYWFGGCGDQPCEPERCSLHRISERNRTCIDACWYAYTGPVPEMPEMPDPLGDYLDMYLSGNKEGGYWVGRLEFWKSEKGGWDVYSVESGHAHLLVTITTVDEAKLLFRALKIDPEDE